MQKPLTYALLLAVTLGLAACGDKPEEQAKPAADSAAQPVQPMGDAAKQAGEEKAAEMPQNATEPAKAGEEAGKAMEEQKQ